jgi:RNA polymerase sigma factor (TIGR02999 family)
MILAGRVRGDGGLSEQAVMSLITAAETGDADARQQLFASLYRELHDIARGHLRREGSGLTLGATTLLHEAYLNFGERAGAQIPDRARFLAYASRAMRTLIIDYARSRRALKRGAAFEITALPTEVPEQIVESEGLQRLSDAIEHLAAMEPRLAQVVDLKYFSGFSFTDIAAMWGVSERTVQRDWEKARALLHHALADSQQSGLP